MMDDMVEDKTRLGSIAGIVLMTNNMIGPGFVALATLYQTAGWLTPTLSLLVLGSLAALAGGYLMESISMMPGNSRLQKPYEFGDGIARFVPGCVGMFFQMMLALCLVTLCIGCAIEASQNMDWFYVAVAPPCLCVEGSE